MDEWQCPACGYEGDVEDGDAGDVSDTAGVTQCPECGEFDWGD